MATDKNIKKSALSGKRQYSAVYEREQNTLGSKILEARTRHGLHQKDLSRLLRNYDIEITAGAISKWEKGDSLPNPYQLFALSIELGIGDVLDYFAGVNIEGERKLNAEGKKKIEEYVNLLVASGLYKSKTTRAYVKERSMKVFDIPASAGTGSFLEGEDYEVLSFPEKSIPVGAEFGIRVSGDSMMPNYVDGQIAWIEKRSSMLPGEVGIFLLDGEAYIKVYDEEEPASHEYEEYTDSNNVLHPKAILVSYNPDYDPIEVEPESYLTVIGKVLN